MNKGFIKSFSILIFLMGLISIAYLGTKLHSFYFTPLHHYPNNTVIQVETGDTLLKLTAKLREKNIDIKNWEAKIWNRYLKIASRLQVGEFSLDSGLSKAEILRSFTNPKYKVQYSITFPEGSNIYDMEAKLKGKWPNFEKSSYWNSIKSTIFLEKHNLIGSKTARSGTLEGFLFPETYQYEKETSIESLIDSALSQFKERALPILKEHPWASTHEGLYKLVTLASIVEKESGHADEQPMIASVFWNRIEKKMRLQSDPTTIYALFPNFDGNLRRVHLNEKTDYNTYQIPSLPLGPIANPGLSAIQAVLNPESSDYLYFVSKGDGYHIFSKDYETHRQRVVQYQIKGRKKRSAASEEQRK